MTSERTRVLGVGAGGHAKVVLDILALIDGHEVVGLLDADEERAGENLQGIPILGGDELLEPQYHAGVVHAFIGLGGAADTGPRRRLYERVRSVGFDVVSAVHPSAVVASSASIGPGATIAPGAVVSPDATLGENVIVNTSAVVDHDCRLGDHVHVAVGACLASGVEIGDGAHVGAGAIVLQQVSIGAGAVVGAGALVRNDVGAGTVVVGVPARLLRRVEA